LSLSSERRSNLELKDKKLNVCLPEFRLALEDLVIKGSEILSTLEPLNNQLNQKDYDEIYSSNPVMLRQLQLVRTYMVK